MLQREMNVDATVANNLSDVALVQQVKIAASLERAATGHLIALLAEFDARRLYLEEGCSSLFSYCTQVLRLSEHAAYGRIEAARVVRRLPSIVERLKAGELTLTTMVLLAPHLTAENHEALLAEARHRSKREVELIVARLCPAPRVPDTVRKAAAKRIEPPSEPGEMPTISFATVAPPLPVVKPLSTDCYKVQVTISRDTQEKLRRVQELLRHSVPNGDLATIIDRGLTLLLSDLERSKCGASSRSRGQRAAQAGSRHIPAAVRREVWSRDGGRCAFIGTTGRCTERNFIEFHHIKPFAVGGSSTSKNIELRCRAHNVHDAEKYFRDQLPLLVRERAVTYLGPDRVQTPASTF